MNDTPRFGTAGLADSYTVKKFDPAAIAAYTAGFGLTAFEYQCGRGVRLAHDKAAALGAACAERDIALSVHAPYYISMSSLEEDKRLHSIDYLLQSCALVKALGGEAIKVSVDSRTHFNPLDYHYDPKTDVPPDVAKIEFVLSMPDKRIGENGHLQPEDRSLIAASLKNIYKPLIASGYTAPCPTLGDLYRDLNKSNLRRAKQLALMLDVFANGSLQAFSHTTNVDMNNRLICFNIQSLGDQLRPIAMMSLLEFINMQVMTNRRKDATAATWIYFDEIHVLLKDPMSSNFLYSSWKRFRKYNAYATGISQDIQDYLDNPVAYALLSNSEFVIMLRQSKSLEALERLCGLSKPQLEFLRNASEGHGIIKMGNSMIPFSNLEPKDTAVYKLITTKPGEATAEK